MDIKTLLSSIHQTAETFDVSGISLNSNTLSKGDLFIALQGEKSHGADYIDSAIENGCVAVLIEGKDFECDVPLFALTTSRRTYLSLLKIFTPKQRMLISLRLLEQMVRPQSVITFRSY